MVIMDLIAAWVRMNGVVIERGKGIQTVMYFKNHVTEIPGEEKRPVHCNDGPGEWLRYKAKNNITTHPYKR